MTARPQARERQDQGERHADHQEFPRDQRRTKRLVHRQRLHRHDRRRFGSLAAGRGQRSIHPRRPHRLAHPPLGQTVYVTEGIGRCQREGDPIEEIRPGDRVFFEPGENHWHGAAPNRFMTHIAMQEADENGSPVTWGEHVTDEQYNAAPAA